jgi:hypothetical protein
MISLTARYSTYLVKCMLWYSLQFLSETFLSSFVKLRKAIISLMSVHPFITRFALKGFWWNLIFEVFFHVHTVHLDNYQRFSPTDAQLDSLKNNLKFALKLTLKDLIYLSSLMIKVLDHVYALGHSYTCCTYRCYTYHFYAYRLYFVNVWHVYEWPKTYTWSGTFILTDGRYTFTWRHEMCGACAVMCGAMRWPRSYEK